jgi:Tfp pilus assembly protein PilF
MQRWQIALSQGMQARRQGDYASAQAVFEDVLAQARQAHNGWPRRLRWGTSAR